MSNVLAPAAIAVGFILALGYGYSHKGKPVEAEFVCYTADKLTERHVGVASAGLYANTGKFYIRYVEGNKVYYTPKPGESCGIEEVR